MGVDGCDYTWSGCVDVWIDSVWIWDYVWYDIY